MVYIGTIDDWFDFNTITEFANKHKDYTIYLIGPVNKKIKTPNIKNIKFLGSIEHKYVPSYIEQSDILLLPFMINDVNNLIYFYKDKEEFEKNVLKLSKYKFKQTDDYKKLMTESCWENRLKDYINNLK